MHHPEVLDDDHDAPRGQWPALTVPITGTNRTAEVEAYVRELGTAVPESFTADTVGLYRFHHPSWDGPLWQGMSWEYVRGWTLPAVAS